jgi:glycosyltransferase involved in cell wall biosynthesis
MTSPISNIQLSVVVPTYNNLPALQRCLDSWRRYAAGAPVELLVIEDGCQDGTAEYLEAQLQTSWGERHLRWFHEDDVHELVCTNRGFREAQGDLLMVWQADMFLRCSWFVDELIATFAAYKELGLLSLSRGLNCVPLVRPLRRFEDLFDYDRFPSIIGPAPLNWFFIQEVDAVIRPWVVRRECIEKMGPLDEAFRPTEFDEADLCYRLREAGWLVATHGYERLGAYQHLGQSTLSSTMSESYQQRVIRNYHLFYERWDATIRDQQDRQLRRWRRRFGLRNSLWTILQMCRTALNHVTSIKDFER